jgi:DNA-binding NtrC family response regulator
VQDLERKKSESQTPLRRSKSMRALLFSISKRRGSLTSISVDGDSQYGKHLTVNAIHRCAPPRL